MPYYAWQGVDLSAKYRRGRSFARSESELDALLLERDIALIKTWPARFLFFGRSIPLHQKIAVFKQLSVLLSAGLQVPRALKTVAAQCADHHLREVMSVVLAHVQDGEAFSEALAKYPDFFTTVMVRMVSVGEQTGTLAVSLVALTDYLESMDLFKKKVRTALLLPVITLGFFGIMVLVMLLVVVPQFHNIFHTLGHDLPWITASMMKLSLALRSWWALGAGVLVVSGGGLLWYRLKVSVKSEWFDEQLLRVPIIGGLVADMAVVNSMQALAMLLENGMHMIPALRISYYVIGNRFLRAQFEQVIKAVRSGVSLHQAMSSVGAPFLNDDIVAMLAVGQESGKMGAMLARVAQLYQSKVERTLQKITILVQPALMLVLGLLIMSMIIAIYAPLFNMADLV